MYSAAVPIQSDARARCSPVVRTVQPHVGAQRRKEHWVGDPRAQCRENDQPRKAARARLEDLRPVLPADAIVMATPRRLCIPDLRMR